ncbi:hypothetical protein BKA93DRAFT_749963 [Sparassis latifolia]
MFFSKSFALLALALSASALSTPHIARDLHHHRSIAQRAPIAEPAAVPIVTPPRRRSNKKRCVPNSSAAVPSSSAIPSSSAVASSSADPVVATSVAPVNVAPSPSIAYSSDPAVASSSAVDPPASSSVDPPASSSVDPPASTPVYTPAPTTSPTPTSSAAAPIQTSSSSNNAGWPFASGQTYTGDGESTH